MNQMFLIQSHQLHHIKQLRTHHQISSNYSKYIFLNKVFKLNLDTDERRLSMYANGS